MGLRVRGFEKFWAAILGGAMSSAVITFALWAASAITCDSSTAETVAACLVQAPTGEAITAGITGVITTLFSAALVYLTATTEPTHPDTTVNPETDQ